MDGLVKKARLDGKTTAVLYGLLLDRSKRKTDRQSCKQSTQLLASDRRFGFDKRARMNTEFMVK